MHKKKKRIFRKKKKNEKKKKKKKKKGKRSGDTQQRKKSTGGTEAIGRGGGFTNFHDPSRFVTSCHYLSRKFTKIHCQKAW